MVWMYCSLCKFWVVFMSICFGLLNRLLCNVCLFWWRCLWLLCVMLLILWVLSCSLNLCVFIWSWWVRLLCVVSWLLSWCVNKVVWVWICVCWKNLYVCRYLMFSIMRSLVFCLFWWCVVMIVMELLRILVSVWKMIVILSCVCCLNRFIVLWVFVWLIWL